MIILQAHGRRLTSVLVSAIRQDFYAKPVAWAQPSSPDPCTESTVESFSLEQAMIPQQAMSNDALSPRTPPPLPADADVTVTGTDGAWWRTLPPPEDQTRWSPRQDAQINYLSTLTIFVKQRTYLTTLPNPNLKPSLR